MIEPGYGERVAEILELVASAPVAGRRGLAEKLCDGDVNMLQEVLSLAAQLDDTLSANHFLDESNIEARFRAMQAAGQTGGGSGPGSGLVGKHFGEFEVVKVLGAGGMGQVYLARQLGAIEREVALKVIRPGFEGDRVTRRFEAERQSLAMMEHPSIATVFAAGTSDSGTPYFAMELVRGTPFTEHCHEQRLSLGDSLRLFVTVCDAVQHAHMKGIIHRDLKPSNILVAEVEGESIPKVIDFGIAKALAQGSLLDPIQTLDGQVVGTPAYMSPEQAKSENEDIDTRSDVYSLGVVLYETLTGVRPFETDQLSFYEIQRLICEGSPPKPSERARAHCEANEALPVWLESGGVRKLQGDLDWIVLKALESDRDHRYSSVAELAADIRSYLRNEPISAGPPTATYVLRKFMRRHRAVTLGVMVAVISLIAAAAISMWFGLSEAHHRNLAEQAEGDAVKAKAEAERVADFQASQLDGLEMEAVGAFIENRIQESIAASSSPSSSHTAQDLSGVNFTDLARDALESTIFERALRTIQQDHAESPVVQARLFHVTARTMGELGMLDAAESPMREALRIRESELGAEHPDTLASVQSLGWLLARLGRYEEAGPHYRRAYTGFLASVGELDRRTLGALNDLALFTSRTGDYQTARDLYQKAVDSCRQTLGPEHADTLTAMNNLAGVYHDLGQYDAAEQGYREVLEARTRVLGEDHPDTIVSVSNLGFLLMSRRKFDEAKPLLERSLATDRRRFGNEHPNTLASLSVMGGLHWTAGDYAEAEMYFFEAFEISSEVLGSLHPLTLDATNNMGLVKHSQKNYEEALGFHQAALAGRTETLGLDHPKTLTSMGRVTNTLIEIQRWTEAESIALQNEQLRRARYGGQHRRTVAAIKDLITLYERWGQHDTNLEKWNKALEQATK